MYQGMNSFHVAGVEQVREPIVPRGVALREPGELTIRYWMKQDNFQAKCGYGEGGSSVRAFWETVTNLLRLQLPEPLTSDIAVKIERIPPTESH